jgi:hypothetical protein
MTEHHFTYPIVVPLGPTTIALHGQRETPVEKLLIREAEDSRRSAAGPSSAVAGVTKLPDGDRYR